MKQIVCGAQLKLIWQPYREHQKCNSVQYVNHEKLLTRKESCSVIDVFDEPLLLLCIYRLLVLLIYLLIGELGLLFANSFL